VIDLSCRADLAERMDDPDLPQADYEACLADLERVNRATRTHRPTLAWLARAAARVPSGRPVSILDVACGRGDLLRAIAARFARLRRSVRLEGIDLNPRSTAAARQMGGPIAYRTGDVFAFTPDPKPDFVVSSQFTHHLSDDDVVRFIGWSEANSVHGWFISDLHRTRYAFWGFRVLCRAAGWHPIVRADGTASIARSFRPPEWRYLLARAGIRAGLDAEVSTALPSRLCVGRLK
jgi:2-polyprenyl-3-methyl-5-hydroxy-6-metoxy-1,4-benzoquinol methylase